MTRDQIQVAIKEGIPFEIRMADGARYRVRERYQVAVGRTSVAVFDDKDLAHILPLLTMTGISYLDANGNRSFHISTPVSAAQQTARPASSTA